MFDSSQLLDLHRWKYARLIWALAIASSLWSFGRIGVTGAVDGLIYDQYSGWVAALREESPGVLVMEADSSLQRDEKSCATLVRKARDLGARRILFTFTPDGASNEFYENLRSAGIEVFFGRKLVADAVDPDGVHLEPLPREAEVSSDLFGIAYIDPGLKGVRRIQQARFDIEGHVLRSIEAMALDEEVFQSVFSSRNSYRILFAGGAGSLPTLDAERVLDGRVIPELIEGKTLIVGIVNSEFGSGLDTPMTSDDNKMSGLEFHGHALSTLITGRWITPLPAGMTLVLLCGLALLTGLICQWVDAVLATWVVLSLLLGFAIFTYVALAQQNVWMPVTELTGSQLALLFFTQRGKAASATRWMKTLLLSSTSRFADKYSEKPLDIQTECWPLIVNMVNQTLDLNRVVFFEAEVGKLHLKEVKALNCSFDDIKERRRDYKRAPYSTSVAAGGPIRVDDYLKKAFDREEQYMIPLIVGGEVLGFWGCGVDPEKSAAVPDFENILREYSGLIAELLLQRRQAQHHRGWWRRIDTYLTQERTDDLYRQLKQAFETLEGRVRQVESLLSNINTATVVYDLFGRVLHINERMFTLLEGMKMNPHRMTALDLVSSVSEYDLSKSRRILRHVIVEQHVITFPVALSGQSSSRYIMHLHPLKIQSTDQSGDALRELSGKCILCELVDTTAFTGLFEMKEKLATRLGLQLRNDLASIDLSSSLLGKPELSRDQRTHISQIIHDKVTSTMDVLVECQQYLSLDGGSENVERFPVDSQSSFDKAIHEVQAAMQLKGIEPEVDRPKLMSYVLASSENLQKVFSTIFKLLISDAADGSVMSVNICETEDQVVYHFQNAGFGIPDERFQEYIHGDTTLAGEDLKTLREGIGWIEAWGGDLDARSEVGVGTQVTVMLIKFI